MSEYQYYEFLALERPLTLEEMAALRDISSRAVITPTSFNNHYEWGDLKADPLDLLRRYFDVFVYVANWGTRWVALRLPKEALPMKAARPYVTRSSSSLHDAGNHVLISLSSEHEEMEDWDEGTGWMASLGAGAQRAAARRPAPAVPGLAGERPGRGACRRRAGTDAAAGSRQPVPGADAPGGVPARGPVSAERGGCAISQISPARWPVAAFSGVRAGAPTCGCVGLLTGLLKLLQGWGRAGERPPYALHRYSNGKVRRVEDAVK
jgi:hypothetical protein